MKRCVLPILLLLAIMTVSKTTYAKNIVTNAKAGANATWSLSEDGVVTIKGKGKVTLKTDKFLKYREQSKKIVICEGVSEIDAYAFSEADCVTEIILPSSLKKLDEACFINCQSLKTITIPKRVRTIPMSAFSYCYKLEKVSLPKGLKKIKAGAFSDCKNLKSLKIPDSVEVIEGDAIESCRSLQKVVLPKKLKKMGENFSKCLSLRTIVNRSSQTISLNGAKGKRTWKVGGKKTTLLKPKKTAKTKGVKYKITYQLSGGKVTEKLPKYYYYGKSVKLPEVTRKGYTFIGWKPLFGNNKHAVEFPKYYGDVLELTAILIKFDIKYLSDGKIQFSVKDDIDWGETVDMDQDGEIRYTFRISKQEDMKNCKHVIMRQHETDLYEDDYYKSGDVYFIEFSYYWSFGVGSDFEEGTKRWYLKQCIDPTQA